MLKNQKFCDLFLEANGLELISKMLQRLPNGYFPNPTFRKNVYSVLLDLPINSDHLSHTKLGKTITLIEKSGEEIEGNLKLIHTLKEKWSRILCNSKSEFKETEYEEYLKERRKATKNSGMNHSLEKTSFGFSTQNIEASQVRRMKRRFDFILAPVNNMEIERHQKAKVN